jgi:hypothetical protein
MELIAIHAGVDLAKSVDYTAVTLAEVWRRERTDVPPPPPPSRVEDRPQEVFYRVQDFQQFPHKMAWKAQAHAIAALLAAARAQIADAWNPHGFAPLTIPPREVYIDATGLGSPMMDMIREALDAHEETRDVNTWPVIFQHGQRDYNLETHTAGKTFLFRRLSALLATDRLELPKQHPLTRVLLSEIAAFRFSIDRDGHETMGAESSAHDDVLTSLALATMVEGMWWVGRAIRFKIPGLN